MDQNSLFLFSVFLSPKVTTRVGKKLRLSHACNCTLSRRQSTAPDSALPAGSRAPAVRGYAQVAVQREYFLDFYHYLFLNKNCLFISVYRSPLRLSPHLPWFALFIR